MVFGLIMFTLVLLMVGMSLDVMRFEAERTRAQNTLDRAVLAAADISQKYTAQSVVDDYFAKAELAYLTPVASEQKGSYNEWKRVTGSMTVSNQNLFMNVLGVEKLETPAVATAEERIGNVEISLVLDVSGSMGSNAYNANGTSAGSKISLLRSAANEFVDTMFTNVQSNGSEPGKLSISVVPYAQQVTLGSGLAGYFNLTTEHTRSTCVDFSSADFGSTAISPTQLLPRTAYADARNTGQSPSFRECFEYASRAVVPFSNNKTAIKNRISGLTAEGDTAIDIGAKWGLAFLDPATRPMLDAMIAANTADATLQGRPFSYDYPDTMKILVLMTDGENTNTYAVNEGYRSGLSPVWKGNSNGRYYYFRDRSNTTYDYYYQPDKSWLRASDIGQMTQQTWQQVWETYSVQWFGNNTYKNATGDSTFNSKAVNHTDNVEKDAQLKTVCNAAKAQGVLIFAIAYEASTRGRNALKNCVTADAYYYDAQGTSIKDAFAGIANAINMLRLTQ